MTQGRVCRGSGAHEGQARRAWHTLRSFAHESPTEGVYSGEHGGEEGERGSRDPAPGARRGAREPPGLPRGKVIPKLSLGMSEKKPEVQIAELALWAFSPGDTVTFGFSANTVQEVPSQKHHGGGEGRGSRHASPAQLVGKLGERVRLDRGQLGTFLCRERSP